MGQILFIRLFSVLPVPDHGSARNRELVAFEQPTSPREFFRLYLSFCGIGKLPAPVLDFLAFPVDVAFDVAGEMLDTLEPWFLVGSGSRRLRQFVELHLCAFRERIA